MGNNRENVRKDAVAGGGGHQDRVQSTRSNRSKTASAPRLTEKCCALLRAVSLLFASIDYTDAHIHFQCIRRSALADDDDEVLERKMMEITLLSSVEDFVFCHSESRNGTFEFFT